MRLPTNHRLMASLTTFLLAVAGCGSDDGPGGQTDSGPGGATDAGPGSPDAALPDGFTTLITADWMVEPPSGPNPDVYRCAAVTLEEDILISNFHAIDPIGTHHAVLSVGDPDRPDGQEYCSVLDNRQKLLYASGVGTDDFAFPEGVAVRVPAGQQLLLNLHLFNASDNTITGTSGVAVKAVESVTHEAEFTLAGTFLLDIPNGATNYEETGSCTIAADGKVINWWPHMHQLGRHITVKVNGDTVLDEEFGFEEQVNYPTDFDVSTGDLVEVSCFYDNNTGGNVGWGDSSTQEMCFIGIYRYPAVGQDFCTNDGI